MTVLIIHVIVKFLDKKFNSERVLKDKHEYLSKQNHMVVYFSCFCHAGGCDRCPTGEEDGLCPPVWGD